MSRNILKVISAITKEGVATRKLGIDLTTCTHGRAGKQGRLVEDKQMKEVKLTARALLTLRVVAASNDPLNGREVYHLIHQERSAVPSAFARDFIRVASLGLTYGALQAHVNNGYMTTKTRMSRGKDTVCYEVTDRGRKILRLALRELERQALEIRRVFQRRPSNKLGINPTVG